MTESTTDESIERIVAERLDSIFGDDEEEGMPPPPPVKTSPLAGLRVAADALKQEIGPRSLESLKIHVRDLEAIRGEDPLFRPLLKMIGMIPDYLGTVREEIHAVTLDTLFSLIQCVEEIEGKEALTDIQRRRRVQKEIESFKAFRNKVQSEQTALRQRPVPTEENAGTPEPVSPETPLEPSESPSPAPPSPIPVSGGMDHWALEEIHRLRDLVSGGFETLTARLDSMEASLENPSSPHPDTREGLSRIERRIVDLSTIPNAMEGFRLDLLKAIALTNKTIKVQAQRPLDTSAFTASVHGELDGLRQEVEAWMKKAEEENRSAPASGDLLSRLHDQMERLQEEWGSLREEIRSVRSDLADLRSSLRRDEAPTEKDAGPPVVRPEPESEDERDSLSGADALESDDSPSEETVPEATDSSQVREGLPTGAYFIFHTGGKKYAVDARHVVKAARIGNGLQKKAQIRGGLTLSDTTSGFFSSKKGLEEAWSSLSSEEMKQTVYRLVSEDSLEGLARSSGGGALFLAVEEKRYLILSDQTPEKVFLGAEDEIQMACGAGQESGPICGSILRTGDREEFYLIVAAERLA